MYRGRRWQEEQVSEEATKPWNLILIHYYCMSRTECVSDLGSWALGLGETH